MEVLIVDDGDDDANSLSNGKSLYQPTLDHPSPIFPHSLDHQSVLKVTAEMEEKDKEEKAISAGIYSYGVWESTV